ncbi:hypothetical protein NQZ68_020787 [Dissostichus eleginoides]|nr:hypothetical protein NQZ68_020787 [Dissostichus eleginoides]
MTSSFAAHPGLPAVPAADEAQKKPPESSWLQPPPLSPPDPPISPSPPLAGRPSPPSLMFPPDTSSCPCTFGEADVSSTPEVPAAGPQWAGPRLVGFRTQWLLQQAGSGSALRLKQTKARERRRAAILLQHRRTHSHTHSSHSLLSASSDAGESAYCVGLSSDFS